ncbi:hypothetical protein GCM10022289_21080 [Pedobacter jeongneungensis]|uniref:Uncharacterized protein n=1 Tax=Pedobacter jeongneungensis TaxID=947309 RepID=A0ABP8BDL6_9SPHI
MNFMKKMIKAVVMAILCFFDEDRQAIFKARSQAESLIKLFTKLAFEELGLKDVFLRTSVGSDMAESRPTPYLCRPLPLPIYRHLR